MAARVVLIVGAGPGIGASVARRFAQEGYGVGLVARSSGALEALTDELAATGTRATSAVADIADASALTTAVHRLTDELGLVDVLHFNPSVFRAAGPLELSADELLEDVRIGAAALLTAVQAARPAMAPGARVTVTGSMAADHPSHAACSLGVQKAAVRNLVLSLDAALAPEGVRATSLTVNGVLAAGTPFAPERVADALYAAATTPEEQWRTEVAFDG